MGLASEMKIIYETDQKRISGINENIGNYPNSSHELNLR